MVHSGASFGASVPQPVVHVYTTGFSAEGNSAGFTLGSRSVPGSTHADSSTGSPVSPDSPVSPPSSEAAGVHAASNARANNVEVQGIVGVRFMATMMRTTIALEPAPSFVNHDVA